jgi:protein phosphatase
MPAAPGVFGAAIQGRRSEQQDSLRSVWLSEEQGWLLIVADGMGGHAAGAVASRIAVDAFVPAFTAKRADGASLEAALQSALDEANSRIAQGQKDAPETAGMGTTLVAAHVSSDGLAWISVGDSPLWLIRRGRIARLNEDHSFRLAAARGAKAIANMLESVLNGEPIPLIDCHAEPVPLGQGDVVILASDGLLTLSEVEIAAAVRDAGGGPEPIVRALLKAVEAHAKPNQDNCTVVAASAVSVGAIEAAPSRSWRTAAAVALAALVLVMAYLIWQRP